MDFKQMLPFLLKGKLGEREQALLKLTENPDPTALTGLLTQMYEQQQKAPQKNLFATLKRIIPAQTLGLIIKYFDAQDSKNTRARNY